MGEFPKSKFGVSVTQGTNPAFDEPNEVLLGKSSPAAKLEQVNVQTKNSEIQPATPGIVDNTGLLSKTGKTAAALVFSFLMSLVIVGGGFYGFYQYNQKEPKNIQRNSEVAGVSTEDIISEVGKLTNVPKNETPNLFKVEDPEAAKLQYPEAYRDIQKGDVMVLYSKQAILYRPSENRVIIVITNQD